MFALALLLALVPAPPAVGGPKKTADTTPTYRFVAHGAARVTFRWAFDATRLHRCVSPYTQRLAVGRHVLRVCAVDMHGRESRPTTVRVQILDKPSGPRPQTIAVSGRPVSLAEGFGSIWVANYLGGAVLRVDPATNRVIARIPVGGQPWGIAVTPYSVWVGNNGDTHVARIDPTSNTVVARVEIGDRPIGIDYDGGFLWVADFGDARVTKIDAVTSVGAAQATITGEHEGVTHGFSM